MRKLLALLLLSGCACTDNDKAKNYGGSMSIQLEPGQKLVNVTWKDNDVWVLTRAARPDEHPEVYVFKEKSDYGFLQGSINLVEMPQSPGQ